MLFEKLNNAYHIILESGSNSAQQDIVSIITSLEEENDLRYQISMMQLKNKTDVKRLIKLQKRVEWLISHRHRIFTKYRIEPF